MKKLLIGVTGLVVVALGVLVWSLNSGSSGADHAGSEDITKLVADLSKGDIKAQSASIDSHQLIVINSDNTESTYELPKDEFFVSIAPYINDTHPCAIHNLATCRGEMKNEKFDVLIVDLEGSVVLSETMQSQANGFVDLWLPRDRKYRVTITYGDKTATSEISTFENDNTCIADMQLV
ncbi:hypothetical protein DNH61_03300 [Paenibacillus sambharensis]|uniref:CueP family metal-binding protein n=1 Tax=Paenibacillus sambharensis TaxID=1803190 RepID=A0A2W1LE68_9BACL|nr:CueP family metal-binding protein [Paenibacillus sambharensis]PZD97386.1 hypothetical protein DNH61_03300 [Paenibacillus sambharensis]